MRTTPRIENRDPESKAHSGATVSRHLAVLSINPTVILRKVSNDSTAAARHLFDGKSRGTILDRHFSSSLLPCLLGGRYIKASLLWFKRSSPGRNLEMYHQGQEPMRSGIKLHYIPVTAFS